MNNRGGGGKGITGGRGPKPFLREGFSGMFCPPLSFPTPFVFESFPDHPLRGVECLRPLVSQCFLGAIPYRAQNQEHLEIPLSESKDMLFDPQHGTHFNYRFGVFNSPLV